MKRTLRNTLGLLLSSALILPFAAGAQTGSRTPVEAGGKGQMAPMSVSPFAPNALLVETFDVIPGTGLATCPANWVCDNNSTTQGTTNWFQGNATVFPAQAGPTNGYIGANFNNTTGTNTISNWLLSPQVTFSATSTIRFWTRNPTSNPFPDRLEVRVSTAGASVNTGTLSTDVGDFTTLVATINPALAAGAGTCPPAAGAYPQAWCEIVLTNVQGIPATGTGRIAFRYFVTGGGPTGANSNYIGIDTFSFNDGVVPTNVTAPIQNFDSTTVPGQPAGWASASNTASVWETRTPGTPAAQSPPNVDAITGNVVLTNATLDSDTYVVTAAPAQIAFFRSHAAPGLESGFDGMVLEVSINGGAFQDALVGSGGFLAGGYNGTISAAFGSAIAGRSAWTGTQAAFVQSIYQLPPAAIVGSTVRFRWRMATDNSVASGVVQIDTVTSNGVTPQADLGVTITAAPATAVAGTPLTYTVTMTNAGPSAAENASFSVALPTGVTLVSATPSAGGVCTAANPVVCTWAGGTATATPRTATIIVNVSPAQTAALTTTVTATSATADPVPANNTASVTTPVVVQSDLSITMTDAPDPVTAGTNLTYTVTVTNNGPSDATGVSVLFPTPAGLTLVSAPGPIGNLAAGASVQSTYVFTVQPSVPDGTIITATATVSNTPNTDPNAANNTATTTTTVNTRADLSVTLTAPVTATPINVAVPFTAVATNNGPSDAQNVQISITLSPDFRYTSHTAAGATCTTPQVGNSGVVTCTWAGPTAPGATRTLVVTAFSNNDRETRVTANTTSTTTDPNLTNNTATLVIQVGFPVEEIPTMGRNALLLLTLLLALGGFVAIRRTN